MKAYKTIVTTLSVFTILGTVYVGNGSAHCDTLDGRWLQWHGSRLTRAMSPH